MRTAEKIECECGRIEALDVMRMNEDGQWVCNKCIVELGGICRCGDNYCEENGCTDNKKLIKDEPDPPNQN